MLTEIKDTILTEADVQLFIKREDLNTPFPQHPAISGNKWRKLKYNLEQAKEEKQATLLTFGGAYSNHIHATAAAGNAMGFKTIGIIRGEETLPLNSTLTFATEQGMNIHYVDRGTYRKKKQSDFIEQLRQQFGDFYLLPEGGTNQLALKGCAEIIEEIDIPFDIVACSCGTGGTFAGLVKGLNGEKKALGFSALKGNFLKKEIQNLIGQQNNQSFENWDLQETYHFGGYARFNDELRIFINQFKEKHNILLDPIYTGKLFFGIFNLIKKDKFLPKTRLIALHTGGLQGWNGINERYKVSI